MERKPINRFLNTPLFKTKKSQTICHPVFNKALYKNNHVEDREKLNGWPSRHRSLRLESE